MDTNDTNGGAPRNRLADLLKAEDKRQSLAAGIVEALTAIVDSARAAQESKMGEANAALDRAGDAVLRSALGDLPQALQVLARRDASAEEASALVHRFILEAPNRAVVIITIAAMRALRERGDL